MPDLYIKKGRRYIKVLKDSYRGVLFTEGGRIIFDEFLTDRMSLKPGLWLSESVPYCKSLSCISLISELPAEPYDFASIMMQRDDLANFIIKFEEDYDKEHPHPKGAEYKWKPSTSELARAILEHLADKAKVGQKGEKQVKDRRLDPDL